MNAYAIEIGTKVELELFGSAGSKIGNTYTGEFMEILGEMEAVIFAAGQRPASIMFSKEIRVKAFFHHFMHGPIRFEGVLTHKEETKTGTKFSIRIDNDFCDIKRREYYRPGCFLKARYRPVNEISGKNAEVACGGEYRNAKTKNISFNGVCILTDGIENIEDGGLVDLTVWLKDTLDITVLCRVIRVMEYEAKDKRQYEVGLVIEQISEADREVLIKYITSSTVSRGLYWGEAPFHI